MKNAQERIRNIFSNRTVENEPISLLEELAAAYRARLKENWFPDGNVGRMAEIDEVIHFLKRDRSCTIGIYEGISVFEAANRIASDIVLLEGLPFLAKRTGATHFGLSFGNHQKEGYGDFTLAIDGKLYHGEVFSTAASFFSSKLSQTNKKWSQDGNGNVNGNVLQYILFNTNALKGKPREGNRRWKHLFSEGNVTVWENKSLAN